MSFLAPLFLLGALAVIGPVLFHLIRRTTRDVTPFSTLMFLQPTPPRVTRRSRLENLWLLLLRCLVVALLALGFARPFWRSDAAATSTDPSAGRRVAILLDVSASMRHEMLWDEARGIAEDFLGTTTPADEVSMMAFDHEVRSLVTFDEWNAMPLDSRAAALNQRLSTLAPGWGATRLDAALAHAAELFVEPAQERSRPGEIVVISDLQEGTRLDALQGYDWPRDLTVTLKPVVARAVENVSAQSISDAEQSGTDEGAPLRVRVSNSAESKREQFELNWSGEETAKVPVYVPAGQTRVVKLEKSATDSSSMRLSGDDVAFDNELFLLPPHVSELTVLFASDEPVSDHRGSHYYVRRAFPDSAQQKVSIRTVDVASEIAEAHLNVTQLMVLGDGAAAQAAAPLASARKFAQMGRTVVAQLSSAASAQAIARLLEQPQFTATEAPVKDYALLGEIDFQHPLFASFADPRFSDFSKIHFWKYRRFDAAALPSARVLARFDSGDPAIVQVPLGKGSVVIFASAWTPSDSQLALSSKFVPLLHSLLEQSSPAPVQRPQYFVGEELPLPGGEQPLTVRKPDGTEIAVAPGVKFTGTDQPGIYSVEPGAMRVAVNLSPEESRTTPLPPERFTSLGVPLMKPLVENPTKRAASQAQLQAAEIEQRQKLWRWLVVGALAVLLLETLLAAKMSRAATATAASR